mgnify:CR=1 FL=1
MKKEILYPALLCLFSLTAVAQWTILDEIQDSAFPAWTLTQSEGDFGLIIYQTDPLDHTNGVLLLSSQGQGLNRARTSAALPLIHPIADGTVGTIYLRYWEEGNDREYNYGFSDLEITSDGKGGYTAPLEFDHFEGIVQMAPDRSKVFLRDGGIYNATSINESDNLAEINGGIWHEVWMVVENKIGTTEDQYAIYIKGGAYTTQTRLHVALNTGTSIDPVYEIFKDAAAFRNGTTDPIVTILIKTISPLTESYDDIVLFDRFAQAPGVELTSPPPFETPCAFAWDGLCPINNDVDTSNWLGWINIQKRPWVYAYSLDSWIWINEANINDQGAWAYIRK